MRRRKYLLRIFRIVSSLLVFLLVIVTLFFLLRSDFFKINTIACHVDNTVCPGQIWTKLLSLSVGKNILFLSPKILIEEIQAEFPDIDGVKIKRILPSKLDFELKLREAIAAIAQEAEPATKSADFLIVDKEGVVFKKTDSSLNLPIILVSNFTEINIGQKITIGPLTQSIALVSLLSKLDLNEEIVKTSEGEILVRLADGPEVAFSSEKELTSQVGSLQLILSRAKIEGKRLKRIDLRFDKPVIVEK